MSDVLVFDETDVETTVVAPVYDYLVFDTPTVTDVEQVDDGDFLVFDAPPAEVVPIAPAADFLILDQPVETTVWHTDPTDDFFVISGGGPKGDKGDPGEPGRPGFDGQDGQDGQPGADGKDGVGVPAGGTAGQVLTKGSGSDYDTEWSDPTGGGTTSFQRTAVVDINVAQVVYLDSNGRANLASSADPDTIFRIVGLAAANAQAGELVTIVTYGLLPVGVGFQPGDLFLGANGSPTNNPSTGSVELHVASCITPNLLSVQIGLAIYH